MNIQINSYNSNFHRFESEPSFILDGSFYYWFITDLINSLMGFIIFVNFICKARIGRLLIQNCSCLKKLFSSFEFVRGSRSAESQAAALSIFNQKLKNSNNDSNSTHSVVLIMSNFTTSMKGGTKKSLRHAFPPSDGASASSSSHQRVIGSSTENSAQNNQIIETSSL